MKRFPAGESAFEPRIRTDVVSLRNFEHIVTAATQEIALPYTVNDTSSLSSAYEWMRSAPNRGSRRAIVVRVENIEYALPPVSGALPFTVSEEKTFAALVGRIFERPMHGNVELGALYRSDRLPEGLDLEVCRSIAEALEASAVFAAGRTRISYRDDREREELQERIMPYMTNPTTIQPY